MPKTEHEIVVKNVDVVDGAHGPELHVTAECAHPEAPGVYALDERGGRGERTSDEGVYVIPHGALVTRVDYYDGVTDADGALDAILREHVVRIARLKPHSRSARNAHLGGEHPDVTVKHGRGAKQQRTDALKQLEPHLQAFREQRSGVRLGRDTSGVTRGNPRGLV